MAFANNDQWQFPIAAIKLQNDPERIAYSFWKVFCIRVPLRIVFCYCRSPSDHIYAIKTLYNCMIKPMSIADSIAITGETLVVVGSKNKLAIFPTGFFKLWELDTNTGIFQIF